MINTLIDAGPMIALFDKDDQYHPDIIEFLQGYNGNLFTSWPVVTEVTHILDFSVLAQIDFLKWINKGGIEIVEISETGLKRIIHLIQKYSDQPMDFADGSLMWISEKYHINNIVTIDSDYYVYRKKNNNNLNNLLDSFLKK